MDASAKEFAFMAASVAVGFILAGLAMALWNRYAPGSSTSASPLAG